VSECRELEPLFTPYVDGEAPVPERERVDAHVAVCGMCRDRVDGERAAREALRARRVSVRACASPDLKARCRAHAAITRPVAKPAPVLTPAFRKRTAVLHRWMPLTAAATIFLAVAAVFGLGLTEKANALAFQTTLDHVKCARIHMPHTEGDPVASAEAWHARFGWPIKVPSSVSEPPLQLRGVRRCGVLDGRVAHIMYSWQGEPLSVYVLPTAVLGEQTEEVRRLGRVVRMWSANDRTYMVISDRPQGPALDSVVAYVRANVR
jgi:anti-sigma factor RsiW